ncbi:MAG: hypothetical protein AAF810_16350 [Cyanobacteria bacterium P01_D01_bin.36]
MATGNSTRSGETPRRRTALGNAHQDKVRMHPFFAMYGQHSLSKPEQLLLHSIKKGSPISGDPFLME